MLPAVESLRNDALAWPRWRVVGAIIGCLVATAVVFWPALLAGLVYDDELIIRRNAALRDADWVGLITEPFFVAQAGYWRPVTSIAMAGAYAAAGVVGVHLLALLAHAFTGAVVFLLGRRWLASEVGAGAAALVFLWHPVQVESVAWASAVSGSIAASFGLLAVLAFGRSEERGAAWPWLSAGLWLLALLAKESAVALLPILFAVARWGPSRERARSALRLLALLGAALGVWIVLRIVVLAEPIGVTGGDGTGAGIWREVSAPAELLLRHLQLLLVPWPLTPFHAFSATIPVSGAVALLLGAIAVVATVVVGWRVAGRRLAPQRAFVGRIGLLLVVLPILPHAASFRVVGAYPLAERYLYVSTVGFALLVAASLRGRWRWLLWGGCVLAAVVSSAQTWVWHDQRALVEHGLQHAPEDPLLHVMAGNLELAGWQNGDERALGRARAHFFSATDAAKAMPADNQKAGKARADAALGLAWGLLFDQQRAGTVNPDQITGAFERALAHDDRVAAAWVGMGVAHEVAGRAGAAESAWRQAVDLFPRCAEAWFYLGRLQVSRGQISEARRSLERAVTANPDLAPARALLDRLR